MVGRNDGTLKLYQVSVLSGLVSMRKDCINSDLGIVCSNHSDINGKDAMEDRQFLFPLSTSNGPWRQSPSRHFLVCMMGTAGRTVQSIFDLTRACFQ